MSMRKHWLADFLGSGDAAEAGSAQPADRVRDGRETAGSGCSERGAATWIPQRRYNVPVEALQRVWRGRRA